MPLNATMSCAAVELKADPEMVTCVPTGPDAGLNESIAGWLAEIRVIEMMLPTAS